MRLPRHLRNFVYLSLPFVAVVAVLFLVASQQNGPWEALGYYFFAGVALLAWGGVAFLYCLYLLVANGLVVGNVVPGLYVVAVVVGGTVWGWTEYREDRACDYAMTFYGELANAGADERAALIAANHDVVAEPMPCRTHALFYWFGHDRYDPDARSADQEALRLATFSILLDEGLPPSDELVRWAVITVDAQLFDVLTTRRSDLSLAGDTTWDPAPAEIAFDVVSQLEVDPDSDYDADSPAYLAMLATLQEAGLDLCAQDDFGKTLAYRLAAKNLIAQSAMPDCD